MSSTFLPSASAAWLEYGWGIQVDTPDQLFRLITRIAMLAGERTYAWRGQNNASWGLNSSLARKVEQTASSMPTEAAVREREKAILEEARRWGLGRDLGASATDLHLLAILQHHGVPTRLLDVTSNPMTALWFATELDPPDSAEKATNAGVLFAIDVTNTDWYETFEHTGATTWADIGNPLGATYEAALKRSSTNGLFRTFPALPDERMKAQEGFFIGSAVPEKHTAHGVFGFNPGGPAPGSDRLRKLRDTAKGPGRPAALPFCAIVIPNSVKKLIRDPLKHTYNRRRRVLFPDVDGFRDGLARNQLD